MISLEQKAAALMQQAKNGEFPEVGGYGRWLVTGEELLALQDEYNSNVDDEKDMQNKEYDPDGFYIHTNDGAVECVDKDDIIALIS
ncbi:MAG: hypothetical protein ACRC8Q_10890 [Aeromonas sp.]